MSDEQESVSILRIGLRQVGIRQYVEQDELLHRCPLLRPLSRDERDDLLRGARAMTARRSHIILREGQTSDALWLVLDGAVSLAIDDGVTDLGMLGKGDFFGIAAVDAQAARPRARAESDVHLAGLHPGKIGLLRQLVPQLARVIASACGTRKKLADAGADFMDRW